MLSSCGSQVYFAPQYVGSSRIGDQTRVPLHWQADSQPLDHQGSPNPRFTDEETEAQREEVTCQNSHSWHLVELGFEPGHAESQRPCTFQLH